VPSISFPCSQSIHLIN